jgi:hypothetical protein
LFRSLLLLSVLTFTVSCSPASLASKLISGGGPNVAANTQIGKTNSQTVGTTQNIAPTVSVRPKGRVDNIDQSVTTNNKQELPLYVWIFLGIAFVVGWVTDTPHTYIKNFRRKKKHS